MRMSDDEGWRLEIPDLPELTKIGGNRCHDPTGKLQFPLLTRSWSIFLIVSKNIDFRAKFQFLQF